MFLNLLEECVPKCTRKSVRKLRAAVQNEKSREKSQTTTTTRMKTSTAAFSEFPHIVRIHICLRYIGTCAISAHGNAFPVREGISRGWEYRVARFDRVSRHPPFRGEKHILNGSRHFKSICRHNGISRENEQEYARRW